MKFINLFACLSTLAVVTAPPPSSNAVESTEIPATGSFDIPKQGEFWIAPWLTGDYSDSPKQFIDRMGFSPKVFHYGATLPRSDNFVPFAQMDETHTDAHVFLSIYFNKFYDLTQSDIDDFVEYQKQFLGKRKVLIRFGPEMNGNWFAWGQRPSKYIEVYRRLVDALSDYRYNIQFVWAPNCGNGYPFPGRGGMPAVGSADFDLMDTNNDGKLDGNDDPYSPFYPGDEYVDWVGMSIYYFGPAYPWNANALPKAGHFEAVLNNNDFYQRYSVEKNKPMIIAETAAAFHEGVAPGPGELNIKQAWWRQFLTNETFMNNYPNVKCYGLFEFRKFEDSTLRDFRISVEPHVREAFKTEFKDTCEIRMEAANPV